MRFRYLFGALALGALVIVSITPEPAQGCHWFGRGQGYGGGYGYGYAAPRSGYYTPTPTYSVAPGPGYAVPGPNYTPAPGVAPGPRPMPAPSATASTVSAKDNSFDPATLNVQVGTTVRWVNNGTRPHTVTSSEGKWDSGELAPGASYTVTFMTAGTYKYHCKLHKGMEGTIVVGEPGKAPVGGGTGSKGY
jgi:plastocyanin